MDEDLELDMFLAEFDYTERLPLLDPDVELWRRESVRAIAELPR